MDPGTVSGNRYSSISVVLMRRVYDCDFSLLLMALAYCYWAQLGISGLNTVPCDRMGAHIPSAQGDPVCATAFISRASSPRFTKYGVPETF